MKYPALTVTAALAAGACLALTGCGGSGKGAEKITGVPGTSTTAQPSAETPTSAAAAPANRPVITLPADLTLTFDGTGDGDPAKDAVWADAAARVRAMDDAIVKGTPDSAAVAFYSAQNSQASAHTSIQWYVDHGYSLTGSFRYFGPAVTFTAGGAALTYCSDESGGFAKIRSSGKKVATAPSDQDDVLHVTSLRKSAAGVWQTTAVRTRRGAAQCRPQR